MRHYVEMYSRLECIRQNVRVVAALPAYYAYYATSPKDTQNVCTFLVSSTGTL